MTVLEQPKVLCTIVIRMLWSVVSKLPTGQAVTKQTHNHCLKPAIDHLVHAAMRFQCFDTFGRQTGTALEGRETANAAKAVSEQYTPVPLTRTANWKQAASVSSSCDQDWPFLAEV